MSPAIALGWSPAGAKSDTTRNGCSCTRPSVPSEHPFCRAASGFAGRSGRRGGSRAGGRSPCPAARAASSGRHPRRARSATDPSHGPPSRSSASPARRSLRCSRSPSSARRRAAARSPLSTSELGGMFARYQLRLAVIAPGRARSAITASGSGWLDQARRLAKSSLDSHCSATPSNWNSSMYHDFSRCAQPASRNELRWPTDMATRWSTRSGANPATTHASAAPQS